MSNYNNKNLQRSSRFLQFGLRLGNYANQKTTLENKAVSI